MIWYIIIQFVAIQFAISVARHDAPAVMSFEDHGQKPIQLSRFHKYNVWMKFFFSLICSMLCIAGSMIDFSAGWFIYYGLHGGLISFAWIYLVFDIALNKRRPGKGWDYLGTNDADGRWWNKRFGKNAGEVKAVACGLFIFILNLIFILI